MSQELIAVTAITVFIMAIWTLIIIFILNHNENLARIINEDTKQIKSDLKKIKAHLHINL